MEEVEVVTLKQVRLRNPVLVEGLPGIGQVGKLVADHLVAELGAEKVMEIYSLHFPPQVLVEPDGSVRLFKNEVYAWRRPNGARPPTQPRSHSATRASEARDPPRSHTETRGSRAEPGAERGRRGDLLIIAGDHQSATNVGYYRLASAFVDIAARFGVQRIYTLGGCGVGRLNSKPAVVGAVNDPRLVGEMRRAGVEFRQKELGSGIVGASGLVLGLAARKSIEAACLLGVTSGYMADPRSAQAVLRVLCQMLDLRVDVRALEARAREMEGLLSRLKEMERGGPGALPHEEELRYIG